MMNSVGRTPKKGFFCLYTTYQQISRVNGLINGDFFGASYDEREDLF